MELIWMEGILLLKEHNPKVQAGTAMEIETTVVVVVTATVVAVILEVVVVVGGVVVEAIATNVASLAISQGSALLVMVGTGMVAGMTGIAAGMVAGMTGMVVAMAAAAMDLTVVAIAILGAVMEEAAMVVVAIDTAVTDLDHMNAVAEMITDLDGGDSVSGMKAIG